MKYTSLFKLMVIGLFVLAFNQSCTNLDEELFDEVAVDDFFQSDEEFIAALGTAYTSLYGYASHEQYISLQEVCTDEILIPQRGGDWGDGGQWTDFHQHLFTPDRNVINNVWSFCYTGVNICNALIFQFTTLGNPNAEAFISELKVLRAYYYLILLDTYGNVPLVTEFGDTELATNSSRAEVFAFVESELLENVPNLSRRSDATTYARVNFNTGYAMLGALYLNAEVYTGTQEWTKASNAYDTIMATNAYSLTANYFDNFAIENSTSPEFIWAIPYDRVNATGFNLSQMTLHYQSQFTYNLQEQPWNGYCSMAEFYNSHEDDDVRKENFLTGPQFSATGERLMDGEAEAGDPDGEPLTFTPEVNELMPGAFRQAGARVGKFQYEAGANEHMNNDFPVYRYAEVIMGKAEALWHLDNNSMEAVTLMNLIRNRANVDPLNGPLTAEVILAERGREFFYEAKRRTDLIRLGGFNAGWEFFTPLDGPTAEQREIFPIPQPQLNSNPALVQNPGY